MASSIGFAVSGCVLIMLIGVGSANAASGLITFSGAVVEPTCSIEEADDGMASRSQPNHAGLTGRLTCGQAPADAGRSYSRTVTSLDKAIIANDRLLGYFASYAPVGGGTVGIVVRTYD